jgi:capsular exopolysaccharide synthesis family protein
MLAIAVPFHIEYLNGRVSDVEHTESTLRIRALGVVPKVTDVSFDSLILHGDEVKSDSHLKESFRLIRTNLAINTENGTLPQVILVTSSMPQEGKTSVAANLALSFAIKGEKTLLIDGDLRRGRAHKLFKVSSRPGLSELLSGKTLSLEESVHQVNHENLHLLTCGKHLNTASELLDSDTFTKLMIELRGKYQRIILDSPPVLGLSETLIMQRAADGVLLVIWSDFTAMSSVKSAMQALQVNGAKFAGFVLNRLDFSTLTNRYKYFYYAPLYYANYQPLPTPACPARKTCTS